MHLDFNSRPHEEVDYTKSTIPNTTRISTHDLTKRSTLFFHALYCIIMYFNSRPHEEVDDVARSMEYPGDYFNSRPHEEVDHRSDSEISNRKNFNSRPHEEVDSRKINGGLTWQNFNSRPHEEVDMEWQTSNILPPIFQLTTSRRGRLSRLQGQQNRNQNFNSRPHEEVDFHQIRLCHAKNYFNSRPHEEVDLNGSGVFIAEGISTHDLTKRSTYRICH